VSCIMCHQDDAQEIVTFQSGEQMHVSHIQALKCKCGHEWVDGGDLTYTAELLAWTCPRCTWKLQLGVAQ